MVVKLFLKISQNSQENACARVSRTPFFIEHLRWLLLRFVRVRNRRGGTKGEFLIERYLGISGRENYNKGEEVFKMLGLRGDKISMGDLRGNQRG